MAAPKQLTLFPQNPVKPEDIGKTTPIGKTLELFVQHLKREGKTEHTIKAFLGDMHLLGEFSGLDMPVGNYNTPYLNDYLKWVEYGRGVPCSRKTYARRVTTLKVFFKWLYAVKAINYDPAKPILQRSGPAPLSNVLTQEQVRECLGLAQMMKKGDEIDHRPQLILRLLLETGIKKSETERLTLADIDRTQREDPAIFIRHEVNNVYKERRLPISTDLLRVLEFYLRQYTPKEAVFTCTTRNLEYIITDIGQQADIPFKLSFENLRWTMAVRDWRSGVDEETIRETLGISKITWYETGHKIKQLAEQQITEENEG